MDDINGIPSVMYHYCDLNALLGILTQKKIWLSSSSRMNDTLENKWIDQYLDDLLKEFGYRKILTKLLYNYKKDSINPYISCFSKSGDILSQWRAYADDGNGVAIGFNRDFFNFSTVFEDYIENSNPIILAPIIYEESEQKELLVQLVNKAEKIYDDGGTSDDVDAACIQGTFALRGLAITSKNTAFREEAEIRMIYMPKIPFLISHLKGIDRVLDNNNFPLKFRFKGNHITSYYELDISKGKIKDPINSIILGPKNTMTIDEVMTILTATNINVSVDKILRSKASYR